VSKNPHVKILKKSHNSCQQRRGREKGEGGRRGDGENCREGGGEKEKQENLDVSGVLSSESKDGV